MKFINISEFPPPFINSLSWNEAQCWYYSIPVKKFSQRQYKGTTSIKIYNKFTSQSHPLIACNSIESYANYKWWSNKHIQHKQTMWLPFRFHLSKSGTFHVDDIEIGYQQGVFQRPFPRRLLNKKIPMSNYH